jgi:hypothetical protein
VYVCVCVCVEVPAPENVVPLRVLRIRTVFLTPLSLPLLSGQLSSVRWYFVYASSAGVFFFFRRRPHRACDIISTRISTRSPLPIMCVYVYSVHEKLPSRLQVIDYYYYYYYYYYTGTVLSLLLICFYCYAIHAQIYACG